MEYVKDCFGQPLEIGDEVYWANKIAGQKRSVDRCTVLGFTPTGQTKLRLASGEARNAVFDESLAKATPAEDQTLHVGDAVLCLRMQVGTRCSLEIHEVVKVTNKRVTVRTDSRYHPIITVNRDCVVRVTADEKQRLLALGAVYRQECLKAMDEYFARIDAQGGNPFKRSGNSLVFNDGK